MKPKKFRSKSKSKNIKKNPFRLLKIIPDVLDTLPKAKLEVIYSNDIKVDRGNVLTPKNVKEPPEVTWEADEEILYLLVMIDPDVPSRIQPKFREWQHWLIGNIPGKEISEGETLSEYIGACPPKGTDLHRYIFLLYQQPDRLKFEEAKLTNKSGKGRGMFSIREFALKYNLGNPIAANFFRAEWDGYVPILYKQLQG